jgi:hypothetical protein
MAFAGPTYASSRSFSAPVPVARSLACRADAQRRCQLAVQVALAVIHVASRASSAPTETLRVSAARTSQSAEMGGSIFQSLIALGLRLVRHPLPLAVQLVRSGLPIILAHTRAASSARVTRAPGAMVAKALRRGHATLRCLMHFAPTSCRTSAQHARWRGPTATTANVREAGTSTAPTEHGRTLPRTPARNASLDGPGCDCRTPCR